MTEERSSYARRFVRSARLLLAFQLIAALATLGVTAWAAFYVADLREERDQLRAAIEQERDRPATPTDIIAEPPIERVPAEDSVPVGEEPEQGATAQSPPRPATSTSPAPLPPAATPRPTPTRPATTAPRPRHDRPEPRPSNPPQRDPGAAGSEETPSPATETSSAATSPARPDNGTAEQPDRDIRIRKVIDAVGRLENRLRRRSDSQDEQRPDSSPNDPRLR